MQRIPTLDGWRGVAISLVLLDHTVLAMRTTYHVPTWMFAIGQHGVTIFFVLSGYLITSRLMAERAATGRVDLREFYRRRFLRLMPAAWCYLGLAALITMVQHNGGWWDIVAALLFFRNYVDLSGGHELTGHFWSLSIEEQFYLVWPAVLIALPARVAVALLAVGAMAVATLRFFVSTRGGPEPQMFFLQTQYRADALLVGCLLAMTVPYVVRRLRGWAVTPLLVLFALCVRFNHGMIPLYESVVIALMLAATSCDPGGWVARVLDARPMRMLGAVSYSLYVWQQIVFLWMGTRPRLLWVGLPCLVLIALFSYTVIEQPLRSLGRKARGEGAARAEADSGTTVST